MSKSPQAKKRLSTTKSDFDATEMPKKAGRGKKSKSPRGKPLKTKNENETKSTINQPQSKSRCKKGEELKKKTRGKDENSMEKSQPKKKSFGITEEETPRKRTRNRSGNEKESITESLGENGKSWKKSEEEKETSRRNLKSRSRKDDAPEKTPRKDGNSLKESAQLNRKSCGKRERLTPAPHEDKDSSKHSPRQSRGRLSKLKESKEKSILTNKLKGEMSPLVSFVEESSKTVSIDKVNRNKAKQEDEALEADVNGRGKRRLSFDFQPKTKKFKPNSATDDPLIDSSSLPSLMHSSRDVTSKTPLEPWVVLCRKMDPDCAICGFLFTQRYFNTSVPCDERQSSKENVREAKKSVMNSTAFDMEDVFKDEELDLLLDLNACVERVELTEEEQKELLQREKEKNKQESQRKKVKEKVKQEEKRREKKPHNGAGEKMTVKSLSSKTVHQKCFQPFVSLRKIQSGEFHDQGDNVKQGDHLIPRRERIAT